VAKTEPGKPDPGPPPCPGCRNLEARLKAADERIAALKAAHPDAVLTAEKEFLADQAAALRAEVTRLRARLSAAPGGSGETDRGDGTETPGETADSDVCAGCGGPGAPAWLLQPNGVRGEHAVCDRCLETARRKHPEVVFSREKLCGMPA